MTAKEYFRQAYRLNQKINSDIAELDELRAMSRTITSSALSEKVVRSHSGDAPFVKASGSTLMACEQTDRICYTVELDEKFCDVIVNRYIEQVGSDSDVSVLRDGVTLTYKEVVAADE